MDKIHTIPLNICKLYFTDVQNIATFKKGSTAAHRKLQFKSNYTWEELYFSKSNYDFTENQERLEPGVLNKQNLLLSYPGEDVSCRYDFLRLSNIKTIVRMDYGTGLMKLLGTLDNPCLALVNSASKILGSQINFSRNGEACYWLEL